MLSLANLEFEVLQQTEIETVYPRSASGISLSILSFVILQVRILLYEFPESNAVFLCLEVDFTIILGIYIRSLLMPSPFMSLV